MWNGLRRLSLVCAWCVCSLAASSLVLAQAQPQGQAQGQQGLMNMGATDMSDDQARAHFQIGTSLYESGRFVAAAEEWQKAYDLSKRPKLLYNVYVAYRDASDQPKAIDALRSYLATSDAEPALRVNLEARLRAMESAQESAEARRAAEPTPSTEPASSVTSDARVGSAGTGPGIWPLVLTGAGGALLIGGLVTGLITHGKVSDIESACPNDVCPGSFDLNGERDSASTLATVTDVLLVGGVVLTGVGLVWWLTADQDAGSSGSERAMLTAGFACAPGACAGSVRGQF